MAKTRAYRSEVLKEVRFLSDERIKTVTDFAAYLREREIREATGKILGDEQLAQQVRESRQPWVGGG